MVLKSLHHTAPVISSTFSWCPTYNHIFHALLSCYRKLADVTRDNQLDAAEFAVAMHVIQARLRGRSIPATLPETLKPAPTKIASVPPMSTVERDAYQKTFDWKDKGNTGFIDCMWCLSLHYSAFIFANVAPIVGRPLPLVRP